MAEAAPRRSQRSGKTASTTTSLAMRSTRPVAPERIMRAGALMSVVTNVRRRMAAVRSVLSNVATSSA